MKNIYFINPKAGNGNGKNLIKLGYPNQIIIQPSNILHQIKENVSAGDKIIIAGGDGTISLIVSGLIKLQLEKTNPIIILPIGTGNDLARSLSISNKSIADSIERINSNHYNRINEIPIWNYGEYCFINYVSFGVDAYILSNADKYRKHFPTKTFYRKITLGLAGIKNINYRISQKFTLQTTEQLFDFKGKAGVILSNIPYYLGGVRINTIPISEEKLGLTILNSNKDLVKMSLAKILNKKEVLLPFETISRGLIESEYLPLQIDGESKPFKKGEFSMTGKCTILS